jgi:hypothetical protein
MAKTNESFDQHFKEKLDGHREKPSALAWERLESQLPKQSKPKFGIWWAIAASVTALLVAGYAFWPTDGDVSTENLVAEKTELPSEITPEPNEEVSIQAEEITTTEEKPSPALQAKASQETEKLKTQPKSNRESSQKTNPSPALNQNPSNLIAEAETKQNPISIAVPELKTEEIQIALPELKAPETEKLVAQTSTQQSEEPLYRVSIYSNGVKKGEQPDKNLITELGKTVGQVEGLLGKVDDGLITLQDKKDNLFASLTSKKSQGDEKP